jgi:hypothetical protein
MALERKRKKATNQETDPQPWPTGALARLRFLWRVRSMSELRERFGFAPSIEAVLMLDSSRISPESVAPIPHEIVVCSWAKSEQSVGDLWLALLLDKSAKRGSPDAVGREGPTHGDVQSSCEEELIRSWAEREFARERWRLFQERILFFAELGLLLGVFGLGGVILLVSQSRILQATTLTALFAFARPIVKHLTNSGQRFYAYGRLNADYLDRKVSTPGWSTRHKTG